MPFTSFSDTKSKSENEFKLTFPIKSLTCSKEPLDIPTTIVLGILGVDSI